MFLHGFGSTKEDYANVVRHEHLSDQPILAYDAPGCVATKCSDLAAVSIPFLVSVASEVLRARRIQRFDLIGHSMGGLTALMLADRYPTRVVSFAEIEGNLAPEDRFLSRQIVGHENDDPRQFLAQFADRVWKSGCYSSSLFASSLPHKVRACAVRPIFESVDLSDRGNLMDRLLALPLPKMFMYGEQNRSLSPLTQLADNGVDVAEISHSAHWPTYFNAPQMWARITEFVLRTSIQSDRRSRVF